MTMTKADRDQLLQLVKKRERVMRTKAQERSAMLLAEFDAQSAKIHHYDNDAVWSGIHERARTAIEEAQRGVEERCRELGIPAEFAPGFSLTWHGRGQNALAERRAELRRAAKSRIEAIEKEALSKIESFSLEAQTQIIAHGLESSVARQFLDAMPDLDKLMPPLKIDDIQQLVETQRVEHKRKYYLQ